MLSKTSDEALPGASDASASPPVGLSEPASSNAVAKLITLEEGLYAFTVPAAQPGSGIAPGLAVPAVHISAPPQSSEPMEIIDTFGRSAEWIAAGETTLFVRVPAAGGVALVTAYPGRDPRSRPLELELRRLDHVGFAAVTAEATGNTGLVRQPPFATVFLGNAIPGADTEPLAIEILLHIRRRGDVRFVDAPWAGRVGPGLWIESFTILPQQRSASAAIEYKGLTAAGVETEWLSCGSACGSRGMEIPLVGFAVRQKADTQGRRFDCEYSGYFQSGAVVGLCRNGAPCLSATANDPLEGMQLRVLQRQPAD
jgi:hypothetical protein